MLLHSYLNQEILYQIFFFFIIQVAYIQQIPE